jgi:zinc protease
MNMKTLALGGLLALLVVPSSARAQTLTADQVVEKHLAAVGGREALTKITSRKATGVMVISTPGGDLSGPVEMTAKSPNKMRALVRLDLTPLGGPGEMVVDQMFDGTTGWMSNSMQGDTPMSGDQLEGAKNAFFPSPVLNYKEHGFTIALEPNQKVNDRDAYVVLMTPKSGPAARMFFDAQTFMLVRTVSKINSPQLGEVEQVSEPADYKAVDGVQVAFVIYQSAGGQNVTMKFTKIENNVAVDDAVFIKK